MLAVCWNHFHSTRMEYMIKKHSLQNCHVRRALSKKRKLGNRTDADWASFQKHIDGLSTDAPETNTAITCQGLLMLYWNQIIPNLFGTILNRESLTLLVSHH